MILSIKRSAILIIGLFLLLYILPLGIRPLIMPDETRYAEIPREMIVSGDWVVPHLDGLRYFEKPVLGYWLHAVSMIVFGENAFAMRFPSALAVGLSALVIFMLAQRYAGGYSAGIFTAAIFLSCPLVFGVGTFSVLDSVFSMFVTASMAFFFWAYVQVKPVKRIALLAVAGVFWGLAFLTKGFIGLVVPLGAIVAFMIWERRWKDSIRLGLFPLLAAVLVALPWSVMIYLREPDFWHYFFWVEHIKRFISAAPQHPRPFWYFIPILIGGALPWTVFSPAIISGLGNTSLKNSFTRFAVCWFLFPFFFFSASHGKLGTYILPCMPALIILIAIGLRKYLEEKGNRLFTIGNLLLAMLFCASALILVVNQATGLSGLRAYGSTETWKWILGSVGLFTGLALAVISLMSSDLREKIILCWSAPLALMLIASFIMPDQCLEKKAPGEFLLRHADRIRPDTRLVSDYYSIGAVCWFYRRNDVFQLGPGGELDYGLGYDDSKTRKLSAEQFQKLIINNNGQKGVVLIADTKNYAHYRWRLPQPVFEDLHQSFVFAQF